MHTSYVQYCIQNFLIDMRVCAYEYCVVMDESRESAINRALCTDEVKVQTGNGQAGRTPDSQ